MPPENPNEVRREEETRLKNQIFIEDQFLYEDDEFREFAGESSKRLLQRMQSVVLTQKYQQREKEKTASGEKELERQALLCEKASQSLERGEFPFLENFLAYLQRNRTDKIAAKTLGRMGKDVTFEPTREEYDLFKELIATLAQELTTLPDRFRAALLNAATEKLVAETKQSGIKRYASAAISYKMPDGTRTKKNLRLIMDTMRSYRDNKGRSYTSSQILDMDMTTLIQLYNRIQQVPELRINADECLQGTDNIKLAAFANFKEKCRVFLEYLLNKDFAEMAKRGELQSIFAWWDIVLCGAHPGRYQLLENVRDDNRIIFRRKDRLQAKLKQDQRSPTFAWDLQKKSKAVKDQVASRRSRKAVAATPKRKLDCPVFMATRDCPAFRNGTCLYYHSGWMNPALKFANDIRGQVSDEHNTATSLHNTQTVPARSAHTDTL